MHCLTRHLSDDNGRTVRDTFADVKAEALVDAMPDKLEKTRLTQGQTLVNKNPKALCVKCSNTPLNHRFQAFLWCVSSEETFLWRDHHVTLFSPRTLHFFKICNGLLNHGFKAVLWCLSSQGHFGPLVQSSLYPITTHCERSHTPPNHCF